MDTDWMFRTDEYLCDLRTVGVLVCDGSDIPDIGEFVSLKDNCNVVFGWMPVEKLADVTIYPDFIKKTIYELDAPPQHFITKV